MIKKIMEPPPSNYRLNVIYLCALLLKVQRLW